MKQHADKTLEKIKDYLTAHEGEIVLSDKEEELCNMVIMANQLFQSRKYDTWQMTRMLSKCFSCSDATAQMAMKDAQIIFGAKTVYNKSYMAALHLDEINADMIKARERQDWSMVMDLHKIKNKAIEILPTDTSAGDITPAMVVFNIMSGSNVGSGNPIETSLQRAKQLLSVKGISDTEIVEG